MKINERLIRVSSGLIVTSQSLEIGSDISLSIEGTVTKIEYKDNQDGTVDEVMVVKGIICEKVL